MAQLTQNTNWEKTFTLTKQNNSVITLSTSGNYVDRPIKLTMNVRSATAAANTATADAILYTADGDNAGVNISAVIGEQTTTEPTNGYYIAVTASGSGSSKITQAGWIGTGTLNVASTSGVKYFPITLASCTVAGGGLSVTTNYNATPTLSLASGSETNFDNVLLGAKDTATYEYYFKINGSTNKLTGSTKVTRANITDAHTAGYLPAKTATTVISSACASPSVTVNASSSSIYLNMKAASCTVAGGGLTVNSNYSATPTVTLSNGSDTNMTNITIGAQDTATYTYYFKVHGVSGALSGNTKVTRAAITDAHTAGYLPAKTATTVISSACASPSVTINAGSADTFINIKQGAVTVAGGGLSKGAGSVSVSNSGYYNGSNYDTADTISWTTTATSGYYAIKAVGSGKVSRAAITKQTTTAGYLAAETATTSVSSACSNYSSNSATSTYYIKKSTLSASTVTSSSVSQTVTISAGYYPSDRTVTINAMAETVPTTNYSNANMGTYFTTGSSSDYSVSITPTYSNSAGYLGAHTNTNNGGVGYWKIKTTSLTQGTSSLSGTTLTRGRAYTGTGWISSTTMAIATFANTATSGVTYLDISETNNAPVLVSGNYLYINKGYTDNFKISLAKLVPNGSDVKGHADYILSGHSAYDNDGTLVAGSIPTKSATDLTVSADVVTAPAGYYASSASASVGLATITSGAATATLSDPVYSSTNGNFTITASGNVAAPTVNTAGYVSSSKGTKNVNTGGISGTKTLGLIGLGGTTSGTAKVTPVITRTAKPSSDTWIDAASGAATATKPTSGVYVQVNAASVTGTFTVTPKVTTAGYGTTSYYNATPINTTIGTNAAGARYVPIKTGTATPSNATVTATGGSATATVSGMATTTANTGYYVTASATGGNASVGSSSVTLTEGYYSAQTVTANGGTATGTNASITTYIQKGILSATISSSTAGSANMTATGFTPLSDLTSSYYITLNTSAASVKAKANVSTSGYVVVADAKESAYTNVNVSGNGTKLYIPTATATGSVVNLVAPVVTATMAVSEMAVSSTSTSYAITLSTTATNGSVKGKATIGNTTGMVAASTSHTSAATTIAPTVNGNGNVIYIQPAVLSASVSSNVAGSASMSATGFTALTGSNTSTYYITLATTAGSVKAKAQVATEGYAKNISGETSATSVSVSGNGTKLYIPAATATGSIVNLTVPKVTATMAVSSNMSTTSSSVYYISLSTTATNGSVQGKATVGNTTGMVTASTSHTSAASSIAPTVIGNNSRLYIPAATITASISSSSAGSASMAATGFTATSSGSYYVTLSTTAGSVKAQAQISNAGYASSTLNDETSFTDIDVSGDGTKLYIPTATATGSVVNLVAPTVTVSATAPNIVTTTETTNYYVTVNGSSINGSVKGKATVGNITGMVAANSSHTSAASTITPTIEGSGDTLYLPAAEIHSEGSVTTTPTVSITKSTNMATTSTNSGFSFTVGGSATAGRVQTKYKVTEAGYTPTVSATNDATVNVTPTVSGGSTVYIKKAVGTIAMTAGNGTCSMNSNTNVTVADSDSYNNGIYITFKGSGSATASASISNEGYAPTDLTFSGTTSIICSTATATKYLQGVTLNKPSSGESKFFITVPNGDSTITFVFHVDTSGNVTVDDTL